MDQHIQSLVSLGHHVVLLGARNDLDTPATTFPYATVRVVPCIEGYGSLHGRVKWYFRMTQELRRVFREYTVYAVYAPLHRSLLLAYLFPKTWGIPRIYAFCGDVALELESARQNYVTIGFRIKNAIRYIGQCIVVLFSTHILTFSEYAKNLLLSRYPLLSPRKISVIPGSVFPHVMRKKIRHTPLRILLVSRFERRKGIDLMLRAAAELKKKHIPVQLTIVGSFASAHHDYLLECLTLYESLGLKESVSFLHKQTAQSLNKLFEANDLLVMPSRNLETFGMIALTALSQGVPVIGTPYGSLPELLRPIDRRFLSKSSEPNDIANAIRRFVEISESDMEKIRMKIRTYLASLYSEKHVTSLLQRRFTEWIPLSV